MHHTEIVYNMIGEEDNVLDVGGAYQPFLRANTVIDIIPFSDIHMGNVSFSTTQRFTKDTWIQQDITDTKKPWPFKDKQFDFAVCGHVLEDLRDPIYVMSEMTRVAKRGYIEVPSRFIEQTMGQELQGICGFGHHRWIIDTVDDKIRLIFKCHDLHSPIYAGKWHVSPAPVNLKYKGLGMFWEGDVECYEKIDIDLSFTRNYFEETFNQSKAISDFNVQSPYPSKIPSPFLNDGKPHVHILRY